MLLDLFCYDSTGCCIHYVNHYCNMHTGKKIQPLVKFSLMEATGKISKTFHLGKKYNVPTNNFKVIPPYPLFGIHSSLKISLSTYCSLSSFCLSLSTRPSSVRGSGRWSPPVFSLPITKNTTSSSRVVMCLYRVGIGRNVNGAFQQCMISVT